jgi:FkbM family methyltransferase
MPTVRSRAFTSVARTAARLPRFRGKNRAFLFLFEALRLKTQHIFVETVLKAPIPYRVRLDLHSWLQRIAFLTGEYEADTVSFLLELHRGIARPGYLLDIGANIGLVSIPAALLLEADGSGPGATRVVSVEAVPDNAIALRRNVAFNNAQRLVTVIECALGERPGTVDIQVEGDLSKGEGTGTANILPGGTTLDPNGTYECVRIPIQVSTLDSLLQSGELATGCSVVKIDTDGYDLKVLQGGVRFIERNRPVIFGEFSAHCMGWHSQSLNDVVDFAKSLDYMVWQRLPATKVPRFSRGVDSGTFAQDLLLVPSEHAKALAWCAPVQVQPDPAHSHC